jgi:hypothetical protein
MIDSKFSRRQQRARRHWIATRDARRAGGTPALACGAQYHLDTPLASTIYLEATI